jgi:hypothetical protein
LLIGAIGPQSPCGLGGQFQERPNGAAGLLPRAQLKHLTQQHENRHHRGGFLVDRDQAAVVTKTRWENARGKRCRQTI